MANLSIILPIRQEAVAPPRIFIGGGGGVNNIGVWGGAAENFSLTTPSILAINVTNAPFKGWNQDKYICWSTTIMIPQLENEILPATER